MEPALEIRPLRPEDSIDELTDLLHRAYAELGRMGLNYTAVDQSAETTRKRVESRRCIVAVDGARMVGTILVNAEVPNTLGAYIGRPELASFHQFAVAPEHQGRGVGSLLLAQAEHWARSFRFTAMALDTAEPAARLVAFYVRRGYRSVTTVQWSGKAYRSIIMSKEAPRGQSNSAQSGPPGSVE